MKTSPDRRPVSRLSLLLAIGLVVWVFLFGGSARADALSQFFVRSGAILAAAVALAGISRTSLRDLRVLWLLLGAWVLLIALQLLPLPPSIWTALPGREQFVQLAALAGIEQPWRQISLVPHRTANSLLAGLVPLATLLVIGRLPSSTLRAVLWTCLIMAIISAFLGVLQVAAGGSSYFYDVSNRGNAVGLFANRNHQAALLAASVPMLTGLAIMAQGTDRGRVVGVAAALAFVLVLPVVFVTGSRSGLVLFALATAMSLLLAWKSGLAKIMKKGPSRRMALGAGIAVAGAVAVLIAGNIGGVARLSDGDAAGDLRFVLLPVYIDMIAAYFPMGGGFGTFPDLFRIVEPDSNLQFAYVNHAHNDIAELLIEGGVFAGLIALAGLAWYLRASFAVWTTPMSSVASGETRMAHCLALVATVGLTVLLLSSLVDYPLRTPALAGYAAVLAVMLERGRHIVASRSSYPKDGIAKA